MGFTTLPTDITLTLVVRSRGRLQLPKRIIESFGIRENDTIEIKITGMSLWTEPAKLRPWRDTEYNLEPVREIPTVIAKVSQALATIFIGTINPDIFNRDISDAQKFGD
jgi:bifunctional DNA-binding transcriptional regulator/antitoxin component of YhaV-PrlF toxin-antitoxin module